MFLFDLHCDTITKCFDEKSSLICNEFAVDISKLSVFDNSVQTFAVFTDDSNSKDVQYVFDCIEYLKSYCSDNFKIVSDFKCLKKENKVSAIISIENLSFINYDVTLIDKLSSAGVRITSLTWNGKNNLASGKDAEGGLTKLGIDVVKRCEDKGIIIDVSHLNDESFYDVCSLSSRPVIATHSNCRKVCNNKRNLTDEQIRVIVSLNGLIGINLYPLFVSGSDSLCFDDITLHIDNFLLYGANKCIALGTDFDGCTMDANLKSVTDLKKLHCHLTNVYGRSFADDIFYNNAYNFFKNME